MARSPILKPKRMQRLGMPNDFPYGRQRVGFLAPSTGIYGKHVGGKPPINAVRVRRGRG
jgi:hypothetical protein